MFAITIRNETGELLATENCSDNRCTVGRLSRNLVSLKGWRIAATHAEFNETAEEVFVTDLSGGYGVRVNGEKITTAGPLAADDVITIGVYRLSISHAGQQAPPPPKPQVENVEPAPANQAEPEAAAPPIRQEYDTPYHQPAQEATAAGRPSVDNRRFHWHQRIHESLMKAMDLRRIDIEKLNEAELAEVVKSLIAEIVTKLGNELPAELDRVQLEKEVLNEAIGLGPLEQFLANEAITEVMVNSYDSIYYESRGKIHRSEVTFSSNEAVRAVIDRIVAPLGRRIDESSPMVDGRLKDGSRINAIIPPLATKGPCLTIRKFSKKKLDSSSIVAFKSASSEMMRFLEAAIINRKNIIVSGGTGSGKTTFLNVLSNYIPHSERIITVEDSAELQLAQPHTVTLEGRPDNIEGKGSVTIRDLVRNCLRMRPDRIIVGECRGGETLDMLQAMNTGHDGSLTTVHANSPRDLVSRLEVMTMMAGMELPELAIREQIASAINLIVQQARFSDGSRKVTHIAEITGLESGVIQMQNIFVFKQTGVDGEGHVVGQFEATGRVPEFYEDLRSRGIHVDMNIFRTANI